MPRPTTDYEPVNLNALHITSCALLFQDLYLYYFLFSYPERTLVFCNSKDCLRRLTSIFTLLKCKPLPLHADMHQKQRLKNLEKFSSKLWSFSSSSTDMHHLQGWSYLMPKTDCIMGSNGCLHVAVSGMLVAHFCEPLLSSAEEDRFGDGLI